MDARASALLKMQSRMESSRINSVETVWRDCYDYTDPLRGNGIAGSVETANSAQEKQARLQDSTAADSVGVLAANLSSGLTPSNALWLGLDVGDETEEERRWLDDSAKLLWENIHMSNFDAESYECYLDIAAPGQFVLYVDEDKDGGFAFAQWHLSECWVRSTRKDGQVDVIHRKYCLSAEQAESEFGRANLTPAMVKCLEDGKPDEQFEFLHCIEPRKVSVVGAKMAKNMPFASWHIATTEKLVVREGGYHEFPCMVPRWLRVPKTSYGVGPLYRALPDVRQINYLKACEADSADVAIAGMWIAKDDGILNPRNVRIGPKRVVIAADVDSMKPLQTGANFELSEVMFNRLQASIRKIMMADNFPPPDAPGRTAYEWSVRVEILRKLLGPIYGRLQAEYLKPLVERCFGLAYRAGVFKPAPESLRGRSFTVRYVSPMARAQRAEEVAAVQQTVADAANLAKLTGDPSIMDEIDLGEAMRVTAEGRGVPSKVLRKPEDRDKLREQREAQRQQSMGADAQVAAQQVGMEEAAKRAAVGA